MVLPAAAIADESTIVVPALRGVDVKVGDTVVIQSDAWYPVVFQFSDGRISVGSGNYNPKSGKWSTDGGRTWSEGPAPPDNMSVDLGDGEILSISFRTTKRSDGKYNLPQRRSLDGWKTVTEEIAVLDIPRSVPCSGDGGETNEGFLADHSILRLQDGRLMATMYGNYDEDKTPADDFPASFNFKKYRTIVVFSSDKGKTWGNPITVATAPKLAQEGACEPDLVRTADGGILCAMRSGGRPGRSTPCYLSQSVDEGQTWSEPVAILEQGVWPNLCAMSNGIVVGTTGRPGNWLIFSRDNGRTWEDKFRFQDGEYPSSSSYNNVLEVAPNTLLVIYDRGIPGSGQPQRHEIVGTFFEVRARKN